MSTRHSRHFRWFLAGLVAVSLVGVANGVPASAEVADRLLPPTAKPVGTFAGVPYTQYDGIFEGETSTGAFRVPYRITAPADPELGNRTIVVEPPHFAIGLGALDLYLRPELLFNRGFAHAGIGWSTASFGPGWDQQILDPSVPGTYVDGGFEDGGGRTDSEIVVDFAGALVADQEAGALLGKVARRYVTGVSASSYPVMELITTGLAANVFDLALPFTTDWADPDPQPAIAEGLYDGKLVIVNSEFDQSANLVDRGIAPGQYRFYTVAGTAHIPDFLEIPFVSSGSTPTSFAPALRAHFLQADRWVRKGTPPPASYHLKTTAEGETDRDPYGNAITVDTSGQTVPRLPFVELGEARFLTGFVGSYDTVNTITDLGFPTHSSYRNAFNWKVADYRSAGYILPEEAAAMRARAALCPPLTYTETYRDHYDNFVTVEPCP